VEKYSFSRNIKDIETVSCHCKEKWNDVMDAEIMLGTSSDITRITENDLAIGK
jgi:uncharacterized Fe-S cluster-containing MiaB family protein